MFWSDDMRKFCSRFNSHRVLPSNEILMAFVRVGVSFLEILNAGFTLLSQNPKWNNETHNLKKYEVVWWYFLSYQDGTGN